VKEQTAILGPKDPATLFSRLGLAIALRRQGHSAESERELRAVIGLETQVQGPEHADTLKARNNPANALNSQGKNAEAEKEHRAVLAIRERVPGPEHPDVFLTCHNLAVTLPRLGQRKEGLTYAQRERDGCKRTLGDDHPSYKKAVKQVESLEKMPAK